MVGSEETSYRSYFAKSPSTDKTNGKSKPVSTTSSTANAIVDSPGSAKARSIAKSPSSCPEATAASAPRRQEEPAPTPSRAPRPSQARVTRSSASGLISPSATSSDTSSPAGSRNASPEPISHAQALLNKKKKEIVDKVMVEVFHPLFDKWIEQTIGVMRQAADACDDDGTSGRSGKTQERGGGGGGEPKKPLSGQKRHYQRDDSSSNDDDPLDDGHGGGGGGGSGGGGRNGNKRARRSSDDKRFACPYFKHNQKKYTTERTCCGPGWVDVHRVKEHIYRKHALPEFICPRCCKDLKNAEALRQHQRSETPCPLKKAQQLDGFDKHTEKLLRSRTNPGTERQKWEEMYRILFPGDHIPSPYYDDKARGDSKTTKGLAEYEEYLRRELPPKVQRELEVEVEKELNCVEDAMKLKAVEIFRNIQLRLFRVYKHAKETSSKPEVVAAQEQLLQKKKSKRQEETPRLSSYAEPPQIPASQAFDNSNLASLVDDFGWDAFFSLDGPGWGGSSQMSTSNDSGYGSRFDHTIFSGTETSSL